MMLAWYVLVDVLRYWLSRVPRLRGPSPSSYRQSGYKIDQVVLDYRLKIGGRMNYWVLELKHTKSSQLGWVPWVILKGGHLRTHLSLTNCFPAKMAGIEDARIRAIDMVEGQRLETNGITVWGKSQ